MSRPSLPWRQLVALVGLGLATTVSASALRDEALRAALIGTWCNSEDGGRSCWAHDEFSADGRFRACGRTPDDGVAFEGAGRFELSGQRMCYTVTSASESFWVRPGTRYCTDILSIDAQRHVYRDIESGQRFVLYRRPAAQPVCPVR